MLIFNKREVNLCSFFLECFSQEVTHFFNAFAHPFQIFMPLLKKYRVVKDGRNNLGAVSRRIRVVRTNDGLQFGVNPLSFFFGFANDCESADSFPVQREGFREGAGDEERNA